MGTENNLVERQTFSTFLVNFIYQNDIVFTGSRTNSLSFSLCLSLSLSFLEGANVSFAPHWIRHWIRHW